ncbi:MAG TPA: single-stranded DNA-binding protein [Gemmataceae bacterium]|nr:single-stranded DNA-binding protein [Gemmataceae bacterium]
MANLNKVMLIGRLTRDPEVRTFSNGGKVANFGFAVNNRKKNQTTGEWEPEAVFVDIKAFNREKGRQLADLVEQYLRKGHQAYVEGHLQLDQWTSQDGQKQSKLRIVLDDLQFLEPRADGAAGETGSRFQRGAGAVRTPAAAHGSSEYGESAAEPEPFAPAERGDEAIPF